MKTTIITATIALVVCSIAIIITLVVIDRHRAERAFTTCVQDGYGTSDVDEKLAIRERCEGLLP